MGIPQQCSSGLAVPKSRPEYGLHDWADQYGNHGTEVVSEHPQTLRAIRTEGLFETSNDTQAVKLVDYFNPVDDSQRRVFVVVDSGLPQDKQEQIAHFFSWCSDQKLLEKYSIRTVPADSEKTLETVTDIVAASKHFGMRRRDLLIGVGGATVTDIVGFAAAIYRRSAPYITIPTDEFGMIYCHSSKKKLSIDHIKANGDVVRGLLAVSHPPLASFYDPSFLSTSQQAQKRRGLAEIAKIAVAKDAALFAFLEASAATILSPTSGQQIAAAVQLASNVVSDDVHSDLPAATFADGIIRAIGACQDSTHEAASSVAIGTALLSALSFLHGRMRGADLERVLNMFEKSGLLACEEVLDPQALYDAFRTFVRERDGESTVAVPSSIGSAERIDIAEISLEDMTCAMNVLWKHYQEELPEEGVVGSTWSHSEELPAEVRSRSESVASAMETADPCGAVHEWKTTYDTQYHVASVREVFKKDNLTLIDNYCAEHVQGRKQKLLVVVDDYPGNSVDTIKQYFDHHSSAINSFEILSMHVDSNCKNVESMNRVIDAALDTHMAPQDLFLVIGGGTIMDIVGFAASMFKGGSRYLKVPTTLLGMIDAGIAVKVGVNLGNHKNFIGRYYAPEACLNDPPTFLATLPKREFACGLAEAIKMAVLKSSRLFELIATHVRDVAYNENTDEVVSISVYTMLEELQPNLHEHDLRRFVDFGHEFGHIIEGLAKHEVPHGECVAVGMALSSYLARLKGIISWTDLGRILYLTLDMGLPVYLTDYDCCNPNVLWDKICIDGIEHKNGVLYLVVPETVGKATFIDEIPEINGDMVRESIIGLRRYAEWHTGKTFLRSWSREVSRETSRETSREASPDREHDAMVPVDRRLLDDDEAAAALGIHLPVNASKTGTGLHAAMTSLREGLQQTLRAGRDDDTTMVVTLPSKLLHIPLVHFENEEESLALLPESKLPAVQSVFSRYSALKGSVKGIYIRGDGVILAQFNVGDYPLDALRTDLSKALDLSAEPVSLPSPWITVGRIVRKEHFVASDAERVEQMISSEFLNQDLGEIEIPYALGPAGQKFSFSGNTTTVTQASAPVATATAAPAKLSGATGQPAKPHVLAVDIGATYLRIGILGPDGKLTQDPIRSLAPSKHILPDLSLEELQEKLIDSVINEIDNARAKCAEPLEQIAISFGAVINNDGIVEDASILWGEPARGFAFKKALEQRLPGAQWTVLNDISAAAWRYKDEGRFCLITVSSGLSNKVFNPDLRTLDRLDLDAAGIAGEMGHVVVEPRVVDAFVQHSIISATANAEDFRTSKLHALAEGDAQKITARHLRAAVQAQDPFVMRLLEESDVPYCACGNIADLCAYSSGRGALRYAKRLAARKDNEIKPEEVTDAWLKNAISRGHSLGVKVLEEATYPLAVRILQLAADIGLEEFIIVGGFAMKTGQGAYLQALQSHLARLYHNSAYFGTWNEDRVRGLVKYGIDDDNDGIIGMGNYVQHLRTQYRAVEKTIRQPSQALVTRSIPLCGSREVVAKVMYSGICTTDLEILRGQRGYEPNVLGHEGVCQAVEVGEDVKGVKQGAIIVLNPNNPLDDHDKLGHTREGVFQQFIKFGQESLDRDQVLVLEGSSASPEDTLIEPLSTVIAAQERVKEHVSGKNVLIVGAGVMGLMFALMSTQKGAKNVFMANRSKEKLAYVIERQIVHQDKTFVIGDSIQSQVDQVSAGEGVDTVFICTPMGQGAIAAQEAIRYVKYSGCVYLFSGFRSNDALKLDGDAKIDVGAIRSGWKTENYQLAGKPFAVSGSRGSRNDDLKKAARLIRDDSLFYGRVISHVVSLDVLPETMLTLSRDRTVRGTPAKRVVVDMQAPDGLVETAEDFGLRRLHEATRRRKDAIAAGNMFRDLGFDGKASMLGWVNPPAWGEVKTFLESAMQKRSMESKRDFVFCGTGPWAFLVEALKKVVSTSEQIQIHTLQSLDPQALSDLFSRVRDLSKAVCIGISQSGTTLETQTVMGTLRERFDSAGRDYRNHFVWLTDVRKAGSESASGEDTIRASSTHDWHDVDALPLTIGNHGDINALFCAPHSSVAFLTMLVALRETEAVRHVYHQYLDQRSSAMPSILRQAKTIALEGAERLQLNVEASIASPGLTRLAMQLVAQSLGSKMAGFNPRVRVAQGGTLGGFTPMEVPTTSAAPALVKAIQTMDGLATFVALLAHHHRINFVTHPQVNKYKRRAAELMDGAAIEVGKVAHMDAISAQVGARLERDQHLRAVDVIYYSEASSAEHDAVHARLAAKVSSRISADEIDVVKGEEWNHSAYQAAVQNEDKLYVVLVREEYRSGVDGVAEGTIARNVRMLRAIARATYETLSDKALYFEVDGALSRK